MPTLTPHELNEKINLAIRRYNRAELLKLLDEDNAQIDYQPNPGYHTPLFVAVSHNEQNSIELVYILLQRGASLTPGQLNIFHSFNIPNSGNMLDLLNFFQGGQKTWTKISDTEVLRTSFPCMGRLQITEHFNFAESTISTHIKEHKGRTEFSHQFFNAANMRAVKQAEHELKKLGGKPLIRAAESSDLKPL